MNSTLATKHFKTNQSSPEPKSKLSLCPKPASNRSSPFDVDLLAYLSHNITVYAMYTLVGSMKQWRCLSFNSRWRRSSRHILICFFCAPVRDVKLCTSTQTFKMTPFNQSKSSFDDFLPVFFALEALAAGAKSHVFHAAAPAQRPTARRGVAQTPAFGAVRGGAFCSIEASFWVDVTPEFGWWSLTKNWQT